MKTMKGYIKLRKKAVALLENGLSDQLYYHGIHHTLDALRVSAYYLKDEKVPAYESRLLRIGVLYHDIGFTVSHVNHEAESVKIAHEQMTDLGFSKHDIRVVEGLIWATKLPQSPNNDLERIICDVDLDYLGRRDFYRISDQLYRELREDAKVRSKEEWNKMQIKFLESHRYHTEFALSNREPFKRQRIRELKQRVQYGNWEAVRTQIY